MRGDALGSGFYGPASASTLQ